MNSSSPDHPTTALLSKLSSYPLDELLQSIPLPQFLQLLSTLVYGINCSVFAHCRLENKQIPTQLFVKLKEQFQKLKMAAQIKDGHQMKRITKAEADAVGRVIRHTIGANSAQNRHNGSNDAGSNK